MKLFLHSVYREANPDFSGGYLDTLRELASRDRFARHTLAADPESADVILVTEIQDHLDDWSFSRLRSSAFLRRWHSKSYAYCDSDRPLCLLPGLYPSVTQSFGQLDRQASFCYLGIQPFESDPIFEGLPDLLYSFSGQLQNHRCRRSLRDLSGDGEIVDTSGTYLFDSPPETIRIMKDRYRHQVARSKFVLCPRGGGCSSYRLFETMAAGRVPVIISDQWVEPHGPDWAAFSIRVRERDVLAIPRLLSEAEPGYDQLRANCRRAYSEFFSSSSQFNSLGDAIERLHTGRQSRSLSDHTRHVLTWSAAYLRHTRRQARRMASRLHRSLATRTGTSAT